MGRVVWITKGRVMPLIITAPGSGTTGIKPGTFAPEKAAYSATSIVAATTPIPPTASPFLKRGTPPGFTAVGSLSYKSAFPVITPRPGLLPLLRVAGGTDCPLRKVVLNEHPRLVFSIP